MTDGPFIDPGDPPLPFAGWESDPVTPEDHAERDHLRHVAERIRDAAEARRLRDAGITAAVEAADLAVWRAQFQAEAMRLAAAGPATFTSEDVVDTVGLPRRDVGQHRNNAVGGLMAGLAKAGLIRRAGYVQSRRPTSHGHVVTAWQGTRWQA